MDEKGIPAVSAAINDRQASFIAFEILYWCGLRLGELLALTPSDFLSAYWRRRYYNPTENGCFNHFSCTYGLNYTQISIECGFVVSLA